MVKGDRLRPESSTSGCAGAESGRRLPGSAAGAAQRPQEAWIGNVCHGVSTPGLACAGGDCLDRRRGAVNALAGPRPVLHPATAKHFAFVGPGHYQYRRPATLARLLPIPRRCRRRRRARRPGMRAAGGECPAWASGTSWIAENRIWSQRTPSHDDPAAEIIEIDQQIHDLLMRRATLLRRLRSASADRRCRPAASGRGCGHGPPHRRPPQG